MARMKKCSCEICGRVVAKQNPQRTCSMKCRDEMLRKRRIEAAPTAACAGCSENLPLIYRAKIQLVCSRRCATRVFARLNRALGWKARTLPSWQSVATPCRRCGREFYPRTRIAKYCSEQCCELSSRPVRRERKRVRLVLERQLRDERIGRCALCGTGHQEITVTAMGRSRFHSDHITPRARGGTDDPSNLRHVCWFCNLARGPLGPEYDGAIAAAGKAFWANMSSGD